MAIPVFPANMNTAKLELGTADTSPYGYNTIYWRSLRLNDEAVTTDVSTTKDYDTSSGVQFLSSATLAIGLTIEVETLRLTAGSTTTPDLEAGILFLQGLFLKAGQDRLVYVQLTLPADPTTGPSTNTDVLKFWANVENIVLAGGSVTDPSAFTFRLRNVGVITAA